MLRHNAPSRVALMLWRIAACTATVLAVLALDTDTAAAESCLGKVLRTAARYGVATDPPTVAPEGNRCVTTRDLARSGGVVEPPRLQDEAASPPSRSERYGVPTVPDVTPNQDLPAADRTTLQAVLVAARAQERGNAAGSGKGWRRSGKSWSATSRGVKEVSPLRPR